MNFSLNKVLAVILIFLTSAIFVLTAAFFIAGTRLPEPNAAHPVIATAEHTLPTNTYSGFGRLRALTRPTEDTSSATVVFTPWISYKNEDSAFYEELTQRSGMLKKAMIHYFDSHSLAELNALGEERVKEELAAVVNENLILDKIDSLYFSEYEFLE